jgi:hypothetical protein
MVSYQRIPAVWKGLADVRFGSLADIRTAQTNVRFTLNSDRESEFPQKVMSALPLKAEVCSAIRDVRYGPKADTTSLAGQVQFRLFGKRIRNWVP